MLRRTNLLALGLLFLASFALYAPALRWGFWFDDPAPHLISVESRSAVELLFPVETFGYYRPTGLLFYWLLVHIFGGLSPLPFHGLLLAIHALNAWLIGILLYRQSNSMAFSWFTAGLFAFHPLAPEAVAYFGGFFHPLALALFLVAWRLHQVAAAQRSWAWLVACTLALLAAAGAHEIAVAAAPALIAAQFASPCRKYPIWRPSLWIPLAGPAVYLMARILLMPGGAGSLWSSDIEANLLVMLQALMAPALVALRGNSWQAPHLIAATCTLLLGGWLLTRRSPHRNLWIGGLTWFLLTIAPIVLLLEHGYVAHGPRLSYIPAIGIAILWAAPLAALIENTTEKGVLYTACRLAGYLLAAAVALVSVIPIRQQVALLDQTATIVRKMVALTYAAPPEADLVWVNLPYYWPPEALNPALRPSLPWLRWAQIVIPEYSNAALMVRANGGPDRPMQQVYYAGYRPPYAVAGREVSAVRLRALTEKGQVYVLDLPSATFHDLTAEWHAVAEAPHTASQWVSPLVNPPELASEAEIARAFPHNAHWENLALVAAAADAARLPGEDLALTLYWQPLAPSALNDVRATLRLRDRYGYPLVEQSFPLVADYGPDLWQPRIVFATRRIIPIPPAAALGPARLEITLSRDGTALAPVACDGCSPGNWVLIAEPLIGREQVITEMPPEAQRAGILWENGIRLEGWLLTPADPSPGEERTLTLFWRAEQPLTEDLVIFVHLTGPDGVPLAQHDSEPVMGQFPTSRWPTGALIADAHPLRLPEDWPAAGLEVRVGLYRWPSLERLHTAHGAPSSDYALLTRWQWSK